MKQKINYIKGMISCFSFILYTISYAQTGLGDEKKLWLGFQVTPAVSYRHINDAAFDNEAAMLVFKAGIPFLYRTSAHFSWETGLYYSVLGEQTPVWYLTYYNGITYEDSGSVQFFYSYRYLDLPVKANYYFVKKESGSGLYLTGGGSFNFFIGHIQKSFYDVNGKETKYRENRSRDADFYPVIFSWHLGIGWEKVLNDKLKMRISPEYQRNLRPIANEPVKRYFYTLGINFGLLKSL